MDKNNTLSFCAVIIWYNPSKSDIANTHNLAEIISNVFVIDNSNQSNIERITNANIEYFPLFENLGIATALNYGFQKAKDLGFEYALSLDQDSNFKRSDIQKFEQHALQLFKKESTAIVAASLEIDAYNLQPYVKKTNITSGSMTSLAAWEEVGRFKDYLFIDNVDHEFCSRLEQCNFLIYQLPDVFMQHKLGEPVTRKFFGKTYISPGYSADRLYYYFRNRLYLAKLRGESKFKVFRFLFKKLLICIIVERKKTYKIYSALSGISDFYRNKFGKRHHYRKSIKETYKVSK